MTLPLQKDLQSCFEKIASSITECQGTDSHDLQVVLDNMDTLAIIAADSDRNGFQDTCLLVQDKFIQIVEKNGKLDEQELCQLRNWTRLAADYLKQSNTETADALTGFFTISELYDDLDDQDLLVLKELLEKECEHEDASQNSVDITPEHSAFPATEITDVILAIDAIAEKISGSRLPGTMYACFILRQQLEKIKVKDTGLSANQLKLVNDWISNTTEYIANTSIKEPAATLRQIMSAKSWPGLLDNDSAEVISNLTILDHARLASSLPVEIQNALQELDEAYCTYYENYGEAIVSISRQTEILGQVAASNGFLGFQDICLIVAEKLETLYQADLDCHITDFFNAIRWLILCHDYYSGNATHENVDRLITFANGTQASTTEIDEGTCILREMLLADLTVLEQSLTEETFPGEDDDTLLIVSPHSHLDEQAGMIDTSDTLALPHTVSIELIEMLRQEMHLIKTEVCDQVEQQSNNTQVIIADDIYANLALRLERFADACQAAELDGLSQACTLLANNLTLFTSDFRPETADAQEIIRKWPAMVNKYLEHPGSTDASAELTDILKLGCLPKPLPGGVAPALNNLLEAVHVTEAETETGSINNTATVDDISISLPDDINPELVDGLLYELPKQTQTLSSIVQSIVSGQADFDSINKAQRIVHTIKGSANTVGVQGIAAISHQMEDIFAALVKHNKLPGKKLAAVLIEAADCIEEMTEALYNREDAPPHSLEVLQQLLVWVDRIRAEGVEGILNDAEINTNTIPAETVDADPDNEIVQQETEAEAVLHVPASLLDKALRLMGESMIVNAQVQEQIKRAGLDAEKLVSHQGAFQELVSSMERQVELNHWTGTGQVRNKNSEFDTLEFEEYNELHSVTNRVTEAATDSLEFNKALSASFHDIKELLHEKQALQQDIQDIILRARMVPVSTITPRLQRIVRQASRSTGKQVQCNIQGAETLIDSDILNSLIDPLMHILRNAIDHGIEHGNTRKTLGKTEHGQLEVNFSRSGRQIVVSCHDDGAGLNREKILTTASKHGLINGDEFIPDSDLYRLILRPGFSTSNTVTQTSGRGIGMDVVNSEIQRIKGSINIYSEPGQGCRIEITAPLTLTSVHAILIKEHEHIVAISNHAVERILHPQDFEVKSFEAGSMAMLDGDELPLTPIESLLSTCSKDDIDKLYSQQRLGLLVNADNARRVITVTDIDDTQDLFVKSMGNYLDKITGIIGATILGNGDVVPVIDLPELLRNPFSGADNTISDFTITDIQETLPTILIVDDSLSARRALTQVVRDAGYPVLTARDGIEALEVAQQKKPDILLVDMEMPRMDGIELTSHFRGSPELSSVPVIMISSRTTEKHKTRARAAGVDIFMNKPFSEDKLLDDMAMLIQQDVTACH